jgi:hypothetical protein
MTPDQISGLTAVAAIVSQIGTWPIASIIATIVFGPWIVMGFGLRSIEKRHAAVVEMYESNVKLVTNYEKVADEQADTIRLSTSAIMELTTYLRTKAPCYERIKEMVRR